MRLIQLLLRPVYYLLYHHFAWSYDLVAGLVSLGHWRDWVLSILPRLRGRVLEIGFGPGHLQLAMQQAGLRACGLDESRFMADQAARRIRRAGQPVRLVRGYAQYTPFPAGSFDTLVATFPAEYIFDLGSLEEFHRLLRPGGHLIVLLSAWFEGGSGLERVASWLSRRSGAAGLPGRFLPAWEERIAGLGFAVRHEVVTQGAGRLLVLTAVKARPHWRR
jgi:ubiquinone/menaquinone biosynthesis C-methylase UbiE